MTAALRCATPARSGLRLLAALLGDEQTQQLSQHCRHASMSAPTATKKKLNTDQYFDLNAAKKGIVFDIDGTLTDSDDFHHKAFDELLKETDFKGALPCAADEHQRMYTGLTGCTLPPNWSRSRL